MSVFKAYKNYLLLLIFMGPPALAAGNITAIWANTGEDKVTRDELRATQGKNVKNSAWDGARITLFGGRNEVVAFNVILEAGSQEARDVSISFKRLTGPAGAEIASSAVTGNRIFDWTHRSIELFYVRYLQIKGLSKVSYDAYDERHTPERLRRRVNGNGVGSGTWRDRPDHDKFYPDIAVPLELVPRFAIAAGSNQSIWVDIYIPKSSKPGSYEGTMVIQESGVPVGSIPVHLKVYGFTLPDVPSAKTMLYYSTENINRRYLGTAYPSPQSAEGAKASLLRDRHFLLAHRHRVSLIGDDLANDCGSSADHPCPDWQPRLDGSLFTASHGYDGPGVGKSNNVYAIGSYGSWSWRKGGQGDMTRHADAWVSWFDQNAPKVDYFLYLIDESNDTQQIETWAKWILTNSGQGRRLKSMATIPLPTAANKSPSLDIPTTTFGTGISSDYQPLADRYTSDSRKRFYMYNGHRPGSGSFAIEDDGVALRELAWGQFKKHVNRWFFWESTYYNNYQGRMGETNVFQTAHTFGGKSSDQGVLGATGWNYSNGDGVLFYPGTDRTYPSDSYNVEGPFASLRLKHWRRGIQDVDYLTMASAIDPAAVRSIVDQIVPKVLWDYGVDNAKDPTYVRTDISWSNDPQVWERARERLATMIEGSRKP